jgi:hypothetical protein
LERVSAFGSLMLNDADQNEASRDTLNDAQAFLLS